MADGDVRLYPLFDALSGEMLLRPFYPDTPTPHYITLDQIAGFVGQGSIGPEGPEGPPGPEGPEGPAGPPGTGEGASGLSGMVAGQIPIAATPTTVTSSAALSGDVTSNATLVTTLATVNSNVGTFQGLTLDAKGRVTAATNQSYLTAAALASYAPLASPVLTGTPTAPTPGAGTNTTQLATTAFVVQSFAPIGSPTFTGDPKAPTPATGDSDTSIATTAFVKAQNYLTANQSITLSGDISGSGTTSIAATVTQLQGRSVSATAPGTNQVLTWSGSAWAPADPTGGGGGSGTITGVTAGTGLTGGGTTGGVTLNISVPVDVTHGGTGAITAAAARTSLAVPPIASPTFTGKATFQTSGSTTAGLNLGIGVAPSSPAQGDLWLTNTTVVFRNTSQTISLVPITGTTMSGKLTTVASLAGGAGLSLGQGVTPSSPNNGDIWITSTGLAVHYASTTRTVATLSGGTYTGNITTAAATTGAAGLTLPHGTAPTSPVNGDLWTTTAGGLFVRINGVTTQYLPTTGGALSGAITMTHAGGNGLTMTPASGPADSHIQLSNAAGTPYQWKFGVMGYTAAGQFWIYDLNASANRMAIDTAGACFNTTGTWTALSDGSLKQDVKAFGRGLDAIMALNPVEFRYKAGTPFTSEEAPSARRVGLIAQDVAAHIPEIVGETVGVVRGKDTTLATLNSGDLVFVLINAIKELSAKVAAMEEVRGEIAEVLTDAMGGVRDE